MKSFKKKSFLIFLSFVSFSVNSCGDEETVKVNNKNYLQNGLLSKELQILEITPQQIADYHNIAVELYFENDDGRKKNIYEIENSVINLMNIHYPYLMKDFRAENSFLNPFYQEYAINSDQIEWIIDNGLKTLALSKNISNTFIEDLKKLTFNKDPFEEKILYLNTYKTNNEEENIVVEIYKKVLIASNNLWNVDSTTKASEKLKCSSDVIAADAIGAVTGLFLGPVWSIIQGAIVSIAVNESDCECDCE